MGNIVGDIFVPLFFAAGTGAMWFLAYRFMSAKGAVFRHFGTGLALYGVAFAIWTVVVLAKPANIDTLTTFGVVPFAIAHLFFLMAATEKVRAANRSMILVAGLGYLIALFLIRTFVYPSAPGFSENGLFYFNAQPTVVVLYILAFTLSLLPAINAVTQQMKDKVLKNVSQVAFTIAAIGGIVLVTSVSDELQTINGWVTGATYFVLLAVYANRQVK